MPYPRLLAMAGLGLCLLWNSAIALAQSGSRPSISPPQFSHEGGFQPNTFMLRLSHPDPGSMILYTLDGSEPVPAIPHEKDFVYKNLYQRLPHSQDGPLVHDKLADPDLSPAHQDGPRDGWHRPVREHIDDLPGSAHHPPGTA